MADVHNIKTPAPTDEEIAQWWKLEEQDTKTSGKEGPKYVPFWTYGDPRYFIQTRLASISVQQSVQF